MKLQLKPCSAFSILSLTLCGAFLVPDTGWSRPPEGVERVGNLFYRITRKLERSDQPAPQRVRHTSSTTRYQTAPSADRVIRRPQLGSSTPPNSRVWDPYTQQWVPNHGASRGYTYDGRSGAGAVSSSGSVNIPPPPSQPAMPGVRLQARPGGAPPVMRGDTWYIDPAAAEAAAAEAAAAEAEASDPIPPPTPTTAATAPAPAPAKPAAPQGPAKYGTLVPGKPGFVYPPGVDQETKQMLDVRGLAAGQKVRDPRTGQIFLVP